jgi:hypothetical protein
MIGSNYLTQRRKGKILKAEMLKGEGAILTTKYTNHTKADDRHQISSFFQDPSPWLAIPIQISDRSIWTVPPSSRHRQSTPVNPDPERR